MICCVECGEGKVVQVRSLEEKQEAIVNLSKNEDLKSLRSTTLFIYHIILKKTIIHSQALTSMRATKKKFRFNFLHEGPFGGVADLI